MTKKELKIMRKLFMKKITIKNQPNFKLAKVLISLVAFVLIMYSFIGMSVSQEQKHIVKIRNDGTTVIDEKPFFPLGFYHVSLGIAAGKEINTLNDIAKAGFNIIHTSVDSLNKYEELLDQAAKLGVYVLTFYKNPSIDLTQIVNSFKDKPSVFGWSIQDDANVDGNLNCDDILKLDQQVKAIDPNHVTYISSPPSGKYETLNYCSDIIAAQAYPIPLGLPLDTFHIVQNARKEADKFNRSVYANVQTFALPVEREPTFKEVRNMTYQAVTGGAKGIIYYAYQDDDWYLPKYVELWNGLKSLVPEIKEISPILLNGKLKVIDIPVKHLEGGIWKYNNQEFIIILNASSELTENISIPLSLENLGQVTPLFSTDSNVTITNGILSGTIKPLEVRVYSVSK
jgi:hypothetical protein